MEIMMKRTVMLLSLCLLAISARAQEVTYALPATSITVKVDVRQESFFAGPYAAFAKKMLNTAVRDKDMVTTEITRVELVPRTEADPEAWYTCDGESAALLSLSAQGLVSIGGAEKGNGVSWRFRPGPSGGFTGRGLTEPEKESTQIVYETVQTDTAVVQVPVEHKILVEKTLEDKASDAADMILAVRKDRYNIASGNTDASYSGEAMSAALKELDRIEKEYMSLFCGYSEVRRQSYTFEVTPSAAVKNHRYLVFRLADDGPVAEGVKGTPYYLELQPEGSLPEESQDKRKVKGAVRYRIPAVCRVTFSKDGVPMLQTRIPVYQLGRESILYLQSK